MSIKENLKSNRVTYSVIKKIRELQYGVLEPFGFNFGAELRKIGITSSAIKKFENEFDGKRCFIIATGPSLTMEDLGLLKDEYTIGMNSLCKVFPELGWETTFFGVQDFNVFEALNQEIESLSQTMLLCGSNLKTRYKIPSNAYEFPLDLRNHKLHPADCLNTDFSDDCNVRVYDGYTITYSLIQLAVYFGFKEIYLLGCDCGYSGTKHHFVEHGVVDPNFSTAQQRLFFSYEYAKKYMDTHDVKIFNATRGGALEIFPRVTLEDVLTVSGEKE